MELGGGRPQGAAGGAYHDLDSERATPAGPVRFVGCRRLLLSLVVIRGGDGGCVGVVVGGDGVG